MYVGVAWDEESQEGVLGSVMSSLRLLVGSIANHTYVSS
jgi:hypothetical protein